MKQYIICPMSNDYLTKDKKYEAERVAVSECYVIVDDSSDKIVINSAGSAHTKGFPWKVVTEEG